MFYYVYLTTLSIALFASAAKLTGEEIPSHQPEILSVQKIWDQAPHAAFTDLIYFKNTWYCVFRESDEHAGGKDGVVRMLSSVDGETWNSAAVFKEKGVDLRDPKLSITPKGELMLLLGGSVYFPKGKNLNRQPRVAFSKDGKKWSVLEKILEPGDWLWRVTWHQGKAYGVSYRAKDLNKPSGEWQVTLFGSEDGIEYDKIVEWDIPDHPSETTLRFLKTGEMVALVRRGKFPDGHDWIGRSQSPYTEWEWSDAGLNFGGPNFVILPDQSMWASGRVIERDAKGEITEKTTLFEMTFDGLKNPLDLPSGGEDTSYPGMVYKDGVLWISYYSSHEGDKSSIYLAKVKL